MECRVRRNDAGRQAKRSFELTYDPAGLRYQQDACRPVPHLQRSFVETVHAADRERGEIECGRPGAPDVSHGGQDAGDDRRLLLARLGVVRETRGDHRTSDTGPLAHSDGSPVHEGTRAALRRERLPEVRVVHDTHDRAVGIGGGDAHAPVRDPEEEVHRAIKRVDDPGHSARRLSAPTLLREDAVVGPFFEDQTEDQLLGVPVGVADEVGRGGFGIDAVCRSAEAFHEQGAGLLGRVHGEGEEVVCHARHPSAATTRADYRCLMEPENVARDGSIQIVDVRTPAEWDAGHIDGSLHVPLNELPERVGQIDSDSTTVVVCQIGQRSYMAAMYLRGLGMDAHNLDGGLERWVREGRPLVTTHGPGHVVDGMGQILEG